MWSPLLKVWFPFLGGGCLVECQSSARPIAGSIRGTGADECDSERVRGRGRPLPFPHGAPSTCLPRSPCGRRPQASRHWAQVRPLCTLLHCSGPLGLSESPEGDSSCTGVQVPLHPLSSDIKLPDPSSALPSSCSALPGLPHSQLYPPVLPSCFISLTKGLGSLIHLGFLKQFPYLLWEGPPFREQGQTRPREIHGMSKVLGFSTSVHLCPVTGAVCGPSHASCPQPPASSQVQWNNG